jgi:quaternary ammonium compound-resistance protein SugE
MSPNALNWLLLIVAGLFEVLWAYFLKMSEGFSNFSNSVFFFITLGLSMWLLALSLRTIPIGIAYPVWTGVGAVGAVIIGTLFFKEPMGLFKFLFLSMIVCGILGLKIFSKA